MHQGSGSHSDQTGRSDENREKDRPLTPLTLRFRDKLGTSQSVVNHMELNSDVNITWKENVRKIWQFMFAGYADFLQKNKVHVPYLETQPTHF